MKPKVSPTSPKINQDHREAISAVYQSDLTTIKAPSSSRRTFSVGWLLLVIIIGLISGILGLIIFISYGSEIPIINKLSLFSYPVQQSFVISGSNRSKVLTTDEVGKLVANLKPTIVGIYAKKTVSADASAVYLPEESKGTGFILTNEGYIVTTKAVAAPGDKLVVVADGGQVYDVQSVQPDSATDYTFLKINGSGLATVGFAASGQIAPLNDVILLKQYVPSENLLVARTVVNDIAYRKIDSLSALAESSEMYDKGVLLSSDISSVFDRSVAFTLDEQALGIVTITDGRPIITPFAYLTSTLDRLLSGSAPVRPYLGVYTIPVAGTINLPVALSQGLAKGALIYSDDEAQRPSIRPKSPAQRAGLKKGDVITAINDQPIDVATDLADIILGHRVGETITASIVRQGKKMDIKINLESSL